MNKHGNKMTYVSRVMNSAQPQLIAPDGKKTNIDPQDETNGFTLDELYALLDCEVVETARLHDGRLMIFDENGKHNDLRVNEVATALYKMGRPNSLDSIKIVGPVIVCAKKYFR